MKTQIKVSRSRTYYIWSAMKQRCNNPKAPAYHNYGGRGIRVCDRWNSKRGFVFFMEDMGEKPEGMQLDRVNNDGDYTPDNCRWATTSQQALNKRTVGVESGVFWDRKSKKWRAHIGNKHLGFFVNKPEALAMRKEAYEAIML